MVGGLALLMDVHYPERPNGRGIIGLRGSGVVGSDSFDEPQIKEGEASRRRARALVESGYTVFIPNRRLRPLFRFPDAYEDAKRVIRFVRHRAGDYGIDPERIGLYGSSAGGSLASLLALGGLQRNEAEAGLSDVERESVRVQAAVILSAAADVTRCATDDSEQLCRIMRFWLDFDSMSGQEALERFTAVSPITHVSSDDPPMLLIHGDRDELIRYEDVPKMKAALDAAGVTSAILRVRGGSHGLQVPVTSEDDDDIPDEVFTTMIEWFDRHLIDGRVR